MDAVLETRCADVGDLGLVIETWGRSYYRSHNAGPFSRDLFIQVYGSHIREVLNRPGVRALVAYMPGEVAPNDLYGYLVWEPEGAWQDREVVRGKWGSKDCRGPVVHYVYVKEPFRRQRVAHALFKAAEIDLAKPWAMTARTDVSSRIMAHHSGIARFMPTYLRTTRGTERGSNE